MKRIISTILCSLLILSGAAAGGFAMPVYAAPSFYYGTWYNWLAFANPGGMADVEFMCDGKTLFIRGNGEIPNWLLPVYDEETGEVISDISYYPWNELDMTFDTIVIESGVTSICEYFLQSGTKLSSLTSIYIPKTVKHFGANIFYNSHVRDIHYEGTQTEWNAIERDYGNESLPSGAAIHYSSKYSDGSGAVPKPVPIPTTAPFQAGVTSTGFKFYPTRAQYLSQKSLINSGIGSMLDANMSENHCAAIPGVVNTYIGNNNVRTYVPQGFCSYIAKGAQYYLISAYDYKERFNSVIYVLNSSWHLVKTVVMPTDYHNGGIAYDPDDDVIWFTGDTSGIALVSSVMSLKGSTFADIISAGGSVGYIRKYDNTCWILNKSSCLDYHDGRLWVGTCTDSDPGKIIGYKTDGTTLSTAKTVTLSGVKRKLNGFTFGDNNDIYISYSSGRYQQNFSRIAHAKYGKEDLHYSIIPGEVTVNVPRMNEEVILQGNLLYILYESAADEYCGKAYNKTDRITAIDTSLWSGTRSVKSAKMASAIGEQLTIPEDEEISIDYAYDAVNDVNSTEQSVIFIPETSGSYEIGISGLDHDNDLYVVGQIVDTDLGEDDPGRIIGEMSSVSTTDSPDQEEDKEREEGTDEDGATYLLHQDSASSVVNLTAGKTYEISLVISSSTELNGNAEYSGSYNIKTSRIGDIAVTETPVGTDAAETVTTGNSICFSVTPDESGTYLVNWESSGEFSGMTAADANGNTLEVKDNYCDLTEGNTYLFTAMLSEGDGSGDSANVSFRVDKVKEDTIAEGEDAAISGDTMLNYHADADGMLVVKAEASENTNISVYDAEGNLVGIGSNSAVFKGVAGSDYRISCIIVSKDGQLPECTVKLRIEPYIDEPDDPIDHQTQPDDPTGPTPTPTPTPTPASTPGTTPAPAPAAAADPVVGTRVTLPEGTVTVTSTTEQTVAYTAAPNKKSIEVPDTVTIEEKQYKVTQINANAFKGKKIRTVTIGKNVKVIKKNAFKGSAATKLIVKTKKLKKATVKGSLKGSKVKTIQVKVGKKAENKKYAKRYKKIFTNANAGKKVTVK